MNDVRPWAQRFLRAVVDSTVDACFDEWIQSVEEHVSYPKIIDGGQESVPDEPGLYLWGSDRTVDNKQYLVPRYVGRAAGTLTLRKRFVSQTGRWGMRVGRYVLAPDTTPGDTPPQGVLACLYHNQIRDAVGDVGNSEYRNTLKPLVAPQSPVVRGLEAFPPSVAARGRLGSSRWPRPRPFVGGFPAGHHTGAGRTKECGDSMETDERAASPIEPRRSRGLIAGESLPS